jgi:hypothetical protein
MKKLVMVLALVAIGMAPFQGNAEEAQTEAVKEEVNFADLRKAYEEGEFRSFLENMHARYEQAKKEKVFERFFERWAKDNPLGEETNLDSQQRAIAEEFRHKSLLLDLVSVKKGAIKDKWAKKAILKMERDRLIQESAASRSR